MYSKAEASRIRHEFWTTLGRYLAPVPSASGNKVNWVNYHTGVKDIFFRMNADHRSASIAITFEHNDAGIRDVHFDQMLELEVMLKQAVDEDWTWQRVTIDRSGRTIASISTDVQEVSVFDKEHWPRLISFFKPRIIALDAFWQDARCSFA